jgi:hypothetical protein
MTDETEQIKNDEYLKGRENYYTWLKNFNDYCGIEGYLTNTNEYSTLTAPVKAMKKWIHRRIGNGPGRNHFNIFKGIPENLEAFNKAFGSGYADPDSLIDAIKTEIYFDSRRSPQHVFDWLTENLKTVNSALSTSEEPNAELADDDYRLIILRGLENVSKKTIFWSNVYGTLKENKRKKVVQTPAEIQLSIITHWNDHSPPELVLEQTVRTRLMPLRQGNQFAGNSQQVRQNGREQRKCDYCSIEANGRLNLQNTHQTKYCFFGNRAGYEKRNSGNRNAANANQVTNANQVKDNALGNGNKPDAEYFYDTGATPKSFVNEKPKEFTPLKGTVSTANDQLTTTFGKGLIKFGNVTVEATYAPSFSKSLVSGIEIMKSGIQTIVANDKVIMTDHVKLSKESKILATGKYDIKSGLLKMDSKVDYSSATEFIENSPTDNFAGLTMNQIHRKLGHVGKAIVQRTAANDNITIKHEPKDCLCEYCIKGKMRKKNIPKNSSTREIGEVIAADEQGPFRIQGIDDTKYNVKFIDQASGYLKMFTIKDIKDATLLDKFKPWILRFEKRTGKQVKYFMCDQSFDGPFLDYLEEKGITKLKGEEYNYHFPGKVENANYNITRHSRSMLLEAKLPAKYYTEAQLCAAYLHNCFVHSGQTKSPREMVGQRKKSIKDLVPFGTHGYALLKDEWRNRPTKLGKLEPVAVACRMLGYADDDESEEMKGYKVLVTESWEGLPLTDPYIVYSNEVTFDENKHMTALELERPFEVTDDLFNTYDDEFIDEPELIEDSSESENSGTTYSGADESNQVDEVPFVGLTQSEVEEMKNLVAETYGNWFNSANCCGLTPVEVVYALIALTDGLETPLTVDQALNGPEKEHWKAAMDSEYQKLQNFQTYELVDMSDAKNIVKCKWVFKKKLNLDGLIKEYKARLVAKGFSQRYGIDFYETFAPVAKMKSIRAITGIASSLKLSIYQDDAPSAFLDPDLKETVVMQQIPRYEDGTNRVCLLKKTLYGLKQSPREWNAVVDVFMKEQGFTQLTSDNCVYVKRTSGTILIVAVYVDDILTCGKKNSPEPDEFRNALHKRFNMDKGGIINQYLGMKFTFLENGSITIDQHHYLISKLSEFKDYIGNGSRSSPLPLDYSKQLDFEKDEEIVSNDTFPYRAMVGSLMYAMVSTFPALAQPLSVVSKYLSRPTLTHCNFVRHIFQFVRGNLSQSGIVFNPCENSKFQITGYVDAAYANNIDSKSTTGFCFTLNDTIISWNSKSQPVTAISAAESEYIAATEAAKEAIWWRLFMDELGFKQETTILHEDNQACIILSKNPQSHNRTKHIQVRFHFIREKVASQEIAMQYIPTKSQLADIFTKGTPGFKMRPTLKSLNCGVKAQRVN